MKSEIPTLETERLVLRPVDLADAESYEKNFMDYEVISQLSAQVPWPYPKGGVVDYLSNVILPKQGTTHWAWSIFLKEDPREVIGCVDIWREGRPENRGFWLGRKFWGRGIMTEAVEPVMDYAFNGLGFEKLVFANAVGNIRSRRIKEKTGARLIGVAPAKFVNPAYTEHEIWELAKEEWNTSRKTARRSFPYIRLARPGDEPAIHHAHMRSIREVCVRDHGEEEIRGWGYRELGTRWIDAIRRNEVWVVEQGGVIQGLGYIRISSEDGVTEAYLHSLYLTPEALGRKLGARLMALMLEKAQSSGAKIIALDSTITAHEFYKRFGFVDAGPLKKVDIGGHPVTAFPMAKVSAAVFTLKFLQGRQRRAAPGYSPP